ncbi:hypothetical protein QBC40DRAFT_274194 [Triangularia verruculosa]|uniref:Protein transport protein sec73 n=1 Tax=Triangularia verruculosa TaxID=2587418 RepID=A0AAN7AYI7_9PEZI|nr:hypothetical protein QBC40DRAFT_274194 [Triangularia verruculosa]
MPFLRRRGNVGSETDMRRHTLFDALPGVPPLKEAPIRAESSTSDLPAALTSVAEDAPAPATIVPPSPAVPTSPTDLPRDSISVASTHAHEQPRASMSLAIPDDSNKQRRFSMLRFRNASDSQLAAKAKLHAAAEKAPPMPRRTCHSVALRERSARQSLNFKLLTQNETAPEIITTAPTTTFDGIAPRKKPSRMNFAARLRRSGELSRTELAEHSSERLGLGTMGDRRVSLVPEESNSADSSGNANGKQSVTFDEPSRSSFSHAPPAYGDDNSSTLALPATRLSESSRSDASSGDRVYGSTTTTTHTVSTTTTFFKLGRRRKQTDSLFPIAHLQPKNLSSMTSNSNMSSSSLSVPTLGSTDGSSTTKSSPNGSQLTPTPSRTPSRNGGTASPTQTVTLVNKGNASPATALFRPNSRQSGQSSPTRTYMHRRGRSSTMSSLGNNTPRESVDEHLTVPPRTSMSTSRKSFGDLLGLSRLRHNTDSISSRHGTLTPATPASSASKNNSLQISRESIILPERRDDDTPARYLERLLEVVSRSVVAAALSKNTEAFAQAVLRSYMRGFMFFGDPMDMALRKLLMEAELPKETQQIDRFVQAFANRYHECNPGIYASPDQAYFIAFSLLILHTDVFNKNNKHKMQKADYLKNTRGEGIYEEVLEVFYDNITYTPFIHVEDDFDINGERIVPHKVKKKPFLLNAAPDPARRTIKEPVDPYTVILDGKLDLLRPNFRDVMHLEDPYNYLGTAKALNMKELQKTFFKTGVLQIVSARSRPDAFMTEKTASNPEEAHPGIVDIKVTKVGLLWRKDAKKKKTRSPWQEWGAILTGAQLYFFRNTTWVKSLMHQQKDHLRKGHDGDPCIFKPPLEVFKPDALMSTDGAVALMDKSYNKHKHAFVYVKNGGLEEVLLAEDEDEMNDWLAKLNYAAAFRTSGVRMRGVIGGNLDGQGRRALRRLDGDNVQVIQTPTGEVMVSRSRIDHQMAQDILAARREIMMQKITDADEKLKEVEKTLADQHRNARHLSLLTPISQKTRESLLLAGARIAAQLKWTRMEIWKLKCHRDILSLDLEEERQLLDIPADSQLQVPITREDSKGSNLTAQKSPRSPAPLSLTRTSTVTSKSEGSSPVTEVFQTPPTSATSASFLKQERTWDSPATVLDQGDHRKASVTTAISSTSTPATPTRKRAESSTVEKPKFEEAGEDVDADEHDLLAKAGLLETVNSETKSSAAGDEPFDTPERRGRSSNSTSADRLEKTNIRRSLQRTLREGAGHLSHHRHRKGRDSASSAVNGDENNRDSPDSFPRSTGSFVVHGKKASVINFNNNDLQIQGLTAEERIRQRMHRGDDAGSVRTGPSEGTDFQSILTARSASEREHRGSAASASTATARSFRELHRKYSSAQAVHKTMGSLALPYDEDSDAAISFSDGRHTPLPPIDGEEEPEMEKDISQSLTAALENAVVEEDDADLSTAREERNTIYFTPPPGSPVKEVVSSDDKDVEEDVVLPKDGGERIASPPLQCVGA